MSKKNNIFETINLNKDEITIFKSILNGLSTPLQISANTKSSRSKVYTILDNLVTKGLVNKQSKPYGTKYYPPTTENLTELIQHVKNDQKDYISSLQSLRSHIANLDYSKTNKPIVLHYKGLDGFKRVNWNSTKAIDTLRIYEFQNLTNLAQDQKFAEEVRLEFTKKKGFKIKQLTNLQVIEDYTNIPNFIDIIDIRYIPKDRLDITTESMIYNDIVTTYEESKDTSFIIEVYNEKYASMQKQIFDNIWEMAVPLVNSGKFGKAKV